MKLGQGNDRVKEIVTISIQSNHLRLLPSLLSERRRSRLRFCGTTSAGRLGSQPRLNWGVNLLQMPDTL